MNPYSHRSNIGARIGRLTFLDNTGGNMADAALEDDLNNLVMSRAAEPLLAAVKQHIKENVEPIVEEFYRLGENRTNRWSWAPTRTRRFGSTAFWRG